MRYPKQTLPLLAALFALSTIAGVAWSCPFCSAPSLTLSEQLHSAQTAVLVQWAGAKQADFEEGFSGNTTYEVVQIVQDESGTLEKGQSVTLDRYRSGRKGDLFLLLGTVLASEKKIEWSSPLEVTETSFNYIVQAPSSEAPTTERLAYFMKFLEYPDDMVANDAYGEFANSPYKDITPLSDRMPREKLRKWLADEKTVPTRIGLYGLMLGLCGEPEDAEFLKKRILEPSEDFRLGIDGVMGGYLLLAGAEGLHVINETKLKNRDIPFSETFAAMQALRFMWTYGDGQIDKDRLRQSMRQLLDRPELADLVIADLARWKDWSVQDRLMKLYDAEEYKIPSIRRAIVRYMLASTKDAPPDAEGTPEHVARGKRHLEALREKDPKTVTEAERFFFVN
jgi:hypothetical protein